MTQETIYAVQPDGTGFETFVGLPVPEGMVAVPSPPDNGRDTWDFVTEAWVPYKEPADLHAHLSATREAYEVGGVSVTVGSDVLEIETDVTSQAKILGARVAADNDPTFITDWSAKNGYFTLDAAGVVTVSNAVLVHINTSFAAKRAVAADIDAGLLTTPSEVETAFAAVVSL
jgi:hypothetical protein